MQTDIAPDTALAIETGLDAWRTRVLNALFIVVIISAAPLMVLNIAHALEDPRHWTGAVPYLAVYLVIIGLAVFRQLNLRLRAWGLVLLGYAVGALALALGGLAGDGRMYLLAMPMLALILIGVHPGTIASFLSLLILAVFALTAHLGWMEGWLLIENNPLDLESWIYESIVVALCLGLLTTLQIRLYRFLTATAVERTQLLEAAQTSRALYQIASELTSDFTFAVSLESNGRFLSQDMSEAFTRITGYTLDEIGAPGKLAECVYPPDLPLFQQYVETVVSGESCTGEFRLRTKDGDVRWLRVHGRPMWDEAHEQVAQLYGAVQDITRPRWAEEALERRAAQLALLNDIGAKIAAVLDLDDLLDRVASLVQEGFGYHHVALFALDPDRGNLVMRARAGDFANLYPHDHRIRLDQGIVGWVGCHGEKLLANDVNAEPLYVNFFPDEIPTQSELSVPIKVGEETIGVLDVQSPRLNAFDENDVMVLRTLADQVAVAIENTRLYEAVHQELIERKQAEEALKQSEEMARAILNATTESVLLLDDHGTILDLNQTAAQRLGKGVDGLVGLQPRDFVKHGLSPALVKSRQDWVREVVRTGEPVRFEDQRAGIVFDTQVYPLFDAQGNVTRLAIFARDVTAQREAERRAARAERLAAMGQLAAGLAHEINNPLQAIRSNLELVQDFDLEPDEQKARLNVIDHEIERLAGLSQDVLDFARPPDDTRYPISLTNSMNKTLALVNKQLQLAHIQVTTDFPADLPSLSAVPGQIAQVLLNLTVNAIEAIGDGGHLRVTAGVEGDMLVLAVTDDGPPIPEEYMEHLFEPFFTTKPGGTGLGLSICHSIVHQHGGTISVENLEGGAGVTFTVRLPVARLTGGQEDIARLARQSPS